MNEHDLETTLRGWYARTTEDPAPGWLVDAVTAIPDHLPVGSPSERRRHRLAGWLTGRVPAERSGGPADPGKPRRRRRSTMWFMTAGTAAAVALVVLGTSQLLLPVGRSTPYVAPGAGSGATFVVAADGSGDAATIAAAVEAADDGDTILVRPGRYVESVFIDGKDVEIIGDGDRDAIVVVAATSIGPGAPPDSPADEAYAWAFALADTDTRISGLTIESGANAIDTWGTGAPILEDLDVRRPEGSSDGPGVWLSASQGQLRDSRVVGWIEVVGPDADATVVDNELPATCVRVSAGHATVSRNALHGCVAEFGIVVDNGGSATIEGNDIAVEDLPTEQEGDFLMGRNAVIVDRTGGEVVIRDNDIHESATGIAASLQANGLRIESNRVSGNTVGISVGGDGSIVADNEVTSNAIGVLVTGNAPTLDGNAITGNDVGLKIGLADPDLVGNTVCENGTDLEVMAGREPPATAGNEICSTAAVASAGG